jgi:tape measure domain-containing protein
MRLGIDASDMTAGAGVAKNAMSGIAASAAQLTSSLNAPTAALNNMVKALNSVAGSQGGGTAMKTMVQSVNEVSAATGGSVAAVTAFAKAANDVGEATKSGTSLNAFAKSAAQVAVATGSGKAVQTFATAVSEVVKATGDAPHSMTALAQSVTSVYPAASEAGSAMEAAGAKATALGAASKGAAAGMQNEAGAANQAAAASKNAAASFADASDRGSFLNRTLSMAFAFSGGVAVTNLISFLGQALLGFNSNLQQAHIAFQTLIGAGGDADKFVIELQQMANLTPFHFADIESDAQKLLAMGIAGNAVIPIINDIGDAVAALGGDSEKLNTIVNAFGQIETAGKLQARQMRMITMAGIPAWQILADQMGKTTGEVQKMVSAGLIPANEALAMMANGMEQRFGGLMAQEARTAAGALTTIKDIVLETVSKAVLPFFNAITSGLQGLSLFLQNGGGQYVAPLIYAIGIAITVGLVERVASAVASIATLSTTIGATTAAISADMIGMSVVVKGVTTEVTEEMIGVTATWGGFNVPLMALMITVATLAIAWQSNWGGMRDAIQPVVSAVATGVSSVVSFLGSMGLTAKLLLPIILALAIAISTKLVISVGAAAIGFITAGVSADAFSVSTYLAGAASAVAAGDIDLLSTSLRLLIIDVTSVSTIIMGWAVVIALVIMNWHELSTDVVGVAALIVFGFKTIVDGFAMLVGAVPLFGDSLAGPLRAASKGLDDLGHSLTAAALAGYKGLDQVNQAAANAGSGAIHKLTAQIVDGKMQVLDETGKLVDQFAATLEGVGKAADIAGGTAMADFAKAIETAQSAPMAALQNLHTMMLNELSKDAEIAQLMGELMAVDLARGLKSSDPKVLAQAIATQDLIQERLDELTGGAYSAGEMTGQQYAAGLAAAQSTINAAIMDTAAYKSAVSSVDSTFGQLQSTADQYFSELHTQNTQAIDDALKQKQAIIDVKESLSQAPITAAQNALDFQRQQIQEWRLRQAITDATDPKSRRDAILALQDFLAQKNIDMMKNTANTQKTALEDQKEQDLALANAAKQAENLRYVQQKDAFAKELDALKAHIADGSIAWQDGQAATIALLKKFGIDYKSTGALLGQSFADGFMAQISDLQTKLQALGDLLIQFSTSGPGGESVNAPGGPGGQSANSPSGSKAVSPYGAGGWKSEGTSPAGTGGGGITGGAGHMMMLASGMWNTLNSNIRAVLDPNEMVAPAETANLLRAFGAMPLAQPAGFQGTSSGLAALAGHATPSGSQTLIVQIGEQKFAEVTDHALYGQAAIYGRRRISTGSAR